MLSADTYSEMERMRRQLLQQQIDAGVADVKAGRVSDGPEALEKLRNRALKLGQSVKIYTMG